MFATKAPLIFDWDHFHDLIDGDLVLGQQMLTVFLGHLRSDFESLDQAYIDADMTEWHVWVHKIYGACANLRAENMAALCLQGKTAQTPLDITTLHEDIKSAYILLHQELTDELKTLTT